MTPTEVPKLSVRSIADLIAAVPYLLGFHPSDSVVVVAFRGKKVVFAARVDLLPADTTAEDREAAATHLAAVVAKQDVDGVTILGYGLAVPVTRDVSAVTGAVGRTGLEVIDVLRVTDGRYWSYTCDDPQCCPPEGTPFDPTTSQVAAAATYAGQVALPDRAALERQVAPVQGAARESMRRATERAEQRLIVLLDEATTGDRAGRQVIREAGEHAVREAMRRHRGGGRLTDDEVAWLSLLLAHIPVRDYAWERIGREDWQLTLWTDVLCRTEPELAAAPASLLAFTAWRAGQGALASVAVERARQAAPDYSMAQLMDEVLLNGIAPGRLDDWPETGRFPPGEAPPGRTRSGRTRSGRRRSGRSRRELS